jgi:hypothetical protein
MRIDKKLNLVLPVDMEDGSTVYVHSTPVLRETFERYFLVISRTQAELINSGLGWAISPRVAALMLEKVAKEDGSWEGPTGVARGLLSEIVRLTNVLMLGTKGWEMVPLQEAFDKDFFSEDDGAEIKNAITFFTVASWMYPKKDQAGILNGATQLWGGQTESLDCTAFASSLPMSTETEGSSTKATQSSIPR